MTDEPIDADVLEYLAILGRIEALRFACALLDAMRAPEPRCGRPARASMADLERVKAARLATEARVAEERAAAFVTRLAEAGVRRQPEVEAALTGSSAPCSRSSGAAALPIAGPSSSSLQPTAN